MSSKVADVLPAFLSALEVTELRVRAAAAEDWTPGRQGTGYDILPLKQVLPGGPRKGSTPPLRTASDPSEADRSEAGADTLITRSLTLLGTPFEDYWDVYLIRYLEGSHIAKHVDDAQHGKRHRRINALLTPAAGGGELWIDGRRIDLVIGDAVRFYPDREIHEVTLVVGTRLMFSVGAWIEPDAP